MKRLSNRGYVYVVYDMGDGRVLKKERPLLIQYALHFEHGRIKDYVETHKERARVLAMNLSDMSSIGNPIYLSKTSYTQDKVVVFDEYIESHSLEENKKLIDAYIESIFETWRNGYSDIIMNFDRNCGVNKEGKVVLIDFNEVTFDKSEMAERILGKRWINCHSYKRYLPEGPLKEYYASAMERAMTIENLDRFWKNNEKFLGTTA